MITISRKDACELIRTSVGTMNLPKNDDFNAIVFAVNNDTQVRDFLMGLPQYYEMQSVISFLCHMGNNAPRGKDIPFFSVASAVAYETNAMDEFYALMGYITTHAPNYGLAQLLARVARSGWPRETFTRMREELHVLVMKACYNEEESTTPIKESEDGDGQYLSSVSGVSESSEDSGHEEVGQAEGGGIPDPESQSGSN